MKKFSSPGGEQPVSVRVQRDITALPDPSSPAPRPGVPQRDGQPLQYLERSHRADHGRLNHPSEPDRPSSTMHWMISSTPRTEQVNNAHSTSSLTTCDLTSQPQFFPLSLFTRMPEARNEEQHKTEHAHARQDQVGRAVI